LEEEMKKILLVLVVFMVIFNVAGCNMGIGKHEPPVKFIVREPEPEPEGLLAPVVVEADDITITVNSGAGMVAEDNVLIVIAPAFSGLATFAVPEEAAGYKKVTFEVELFMVGQPWPVMMLKNSSWSDVACDPPLLEAGSPLNFLVGDGKTPGSKSTVSSSQAGTDKLTAICFQANPYFGGSIDGKGGTSGSSQPNGGAEYIVKFLKFTFE
jgi:hypothetical protein